MENPAVEDKPRQRPIKVLRAKYRPGNPIILSLNRARPKGLRRGQSNYIAVIREYAAMPAHVPVRMKNPGGVPEPGDIVECICGTKVLVKSINHSF